jgi:NAD(P)-dependent dehydrogenase (short-subunit alcohol dehydrogenase family)
VIRCIGHLAEGRQNGIHRQGRTGHRRRQWNRPCDSRGVRAPREGYHAENLVVVDRNGVGAQATAGIIRQNGWEAIAVTAGVTRSENVKAYVKAALEKYGRIDCFFNNAGIEGKLAPTAEYDEAVLDAVIGVNVKGVFLGLRHVLPEMIRQGIRVNAVCPGPVDTRMIHALEEQISPANPAAVGERYQAAIPSGRYATVDEIANMVLFLCSDLASNTTGGQFVVDQGNRRRLVAR